VKPVSGRRMCRILEQHGWTLVRVKGSHHAFQRVGYSVTIVVPVHGNKDLKNATRHYERRGPSG
jgi:predicted RNA binding protein YcfA (HicA-like mRNA interferase family)